MGLSVPHILLVILVALLLFGGGRVAEIGKGLGQGIRELKKGLREAEEVDDDLEKPVAKPKSKSS